MTQNLYMVILKYIVSTLKEGSKVDRPLLPLTTCTMTTKVTFLITILLNCAPVGEAVTASPRAEIGTPPYAVEASAAPALLAGGRCFSLAGGYFELLSSCQR